MARDVGDGLLYAVDRVDVDGGAVRVDAVTNAQVVDQCFEGLSCRRCGRHRRQRPQQRDAGVAELKLLMCAAVTTLLPVASWAATVRARVTAFVDTTRLVDHVLIADVANPRLTAWYR